MILPRHVLIGYWTNWGTEDVAFIRLKDVSEVFDVVQVAFALATVSQDGTMEFVPFCPEEQFQADIETLQRRGKKVVISAGGATGSIALTDPQMAKNFRESMTAIIRRYGFNGIDINLEGKVRLEAGDNDYQHPTSASIVNLIEAVQAIRASYDEDFIISLAPETLAVQGGYSLYEGLSGAYLPVIHGLRDILTYVQVQNYNSASMAAPDGQRYSQGTPDFHVAMADMLLAGFPIQGDQACFFAPLRPDQVVLGLPASDKMLNDGYTSPQDVGKVLNYLLRGLGFGGVYELGGSGSRSDLRGVMTWSINLDAAVGFRFSTTTRTFLDQLS